MFAKKRLHELLFLVNTMDVAQHEKELFRLSRRKGIMSEGMKEELAKELGFYDVVRKEGWGGIRARDAGNMVKLAIEKAQSQMMDKN